MIISCPSCNKRYNISPDVLSEKSKQKVRCTECKTIWSLALEMEEEIKSLLHSLEPKSLPFSETSKTPPPLNQPPPEKAGFLNRYKIDWVILFIALIFLGIFIYKEKEYLFDKLPPKSILFHKEAVVSAHSKDSLIIQRVNYVFKKQDNHSHLTVSGEILNTTDNIQPLPPIIIAVTKDEKQLTKPGVPVSPLKETRWRHPLSSNQILPGQKVYFETTCGEELDCIEKINVGFIESKPTIN